MIDWIITVLTSLSSIISFNNSNTLVAVLTAICAIVIICSIVIKGFYETRLSNKIFNSINSKINSYNLSRTTSFLNEENLKNEKDFVFLKLSENFGSISINKLKKYISQYYELNRNNK